MADSEDEDLKLAIALSLEQSQSNAARPTNFIPASQTSPHDFREASGLSQLDRKAMEKERLARIAARTCQRSISPPELTRNSERPNKTRRLNCGHPSSPVKNNGLPDTQSDTYTSAPLQYPAGIVKRTWALGHERSNDIKIEEVLQSDSVRIAVLSAFQWDTEWLLDKINASRTKFVLVMQAKEEAQRQEYLRETQNWPHVRLCFPPMLGQVSCMHSKLMLLFHAEYLRVVVPSANLVPYDWGETGVMENSVFLIDLPRLSDNQRMVRGELTPFGEELMYFVDAMGMQEDVKEGLLKFDFEKTKHLGFVHTIGGAHLGEKGKRTGFPGLGRVVRSLGVQTEDPIHIDFAASSIGSLNDGFLRTIYNAAKGQEDGSGAPSSGGKRSKSDFFGKTSTIKSQPAEEMKDYFRVYFPTDETVHRSTGGPNNGGTICLQSKWYDAATFPREIMRDYQSKRRGLLSHNKIMYVRGQQYGEGDAKRPIAWAYMGSANLSESAWGKKVTDRATKQAKLTARNWECGVVIPMPMDTSGVLAGALDMNVFKDIIGLPFEIPGQDYGEKRPWFFMG
ncbi:phospholipase D/nuclease [Viridothelium virens]|uniref:Phospholipase D/nuclease n=1 Tax=Viridothelium virens TaxID=1048519 RepID=A0A6A6HE52_VIRVR|nr:phospholipase D/nuclease [Viridothelium virens]